MPLYNSSVCAASICGVRATDRTRCVGSAPIAAISLKLDATALYPASYQVAVLPIIKCRPSIIVSITATCSLPSVVLYTAPSSPIPTTTDAGFTIVSFFILSINPNSPMSDNFILSTVLMPYAVYLLIILL